MFRIKKRVRFTRRQKCEECNRDFCSLATLRRHVNEQHARMEKLSCPHCPLNFSRKHGLERHLRRAHERPLDGVLENLKEESEPLDPIIPVSVSQSVLFAPSVQNQPSDHKVSEDLSTVTEADALPATGCQEEQAQTSSGSRIYETDVAGQRIIERITKELLDDDGKVVARVIKERFFVD